MHIDITPVLQALIQLVFITFFTFGTWAIYKYFIPWLKSKFNSNELETLKELVSIMIKSAEQLEENGFFDVFEDVNQAKKEYVLKKVKEQVEKWGFTFDEAVISDVIEGLIKETKHPEISQ